MEVTESNGALKIGIGATYNTIIPGLLSSYFSRELGAHCWVPDWLMLTNYKKKEMAGRGGSSL